ncbi:bacillithiol biosynthesis cysteine-adding enzyme BshC [Brumimicrobium mesophilum]|uniref:bacillithiol biosynthesis cysteine-adding enzyme BshC n=1 Tax=Brumimicrobium mesophilum TaxID=392717 RepID=UPI000D1418BA|nr:bacillithiol biosynthesis cysteine-adding enzyme BshC [Brumimicrobium mesophilum]
MERLTIDRRQTAYFSDLANQINDNQKALQKYIQAPFSLANFEQQIDLKKGHFSTSQRELLYKVVAQQMADYSDFDKVKYNVDLLKEPNTFTVTAGHQLNLFGGPLYIIYKIMDAVRLAEELKKKFPLQNFVPVFWLATEDHDFEEINHLHLFHDTFSWESDQKGPVGRFSLNGIEGFKESVLSKFDNNPEFAEFIDQFYKTGSLSDATTALMMKLFGDYGLITINADDKDLKSSFAPIMKRELETHFSEKEVLKTTAQLEEDGFHGQAMARPVNLFYIKDQLRERIIPTENGDFEIGEELVSKDDLFKNLEKNPERFSPNVVLRPLYQEFILPNLCYLGGGGEMAYWLQFKGMFDQTEVPFPIIKVRNSVQWFDKSTNKKIEKLNLKYTDVFSSIHEVKKQYVVDNAEEELDFNEVEEKSKALILELESLIVSLDKGLEGYAKSEATKIQKQVHGVQQKLIRHSKKKNEDAMKQIDGIYNRLFPNNGLQERYDNMIPFLGKYGPKEFVKMVYEIIDPEEEDLILVIEG